MATSHLNDPSIFHLRDQRNQWLQESLRNDSYHRHGYSSQTAYGSHGDFFTVRSGVKEERERSKDLRSSPLFTQISYVSSPRVCVCVCACVRQVCV